MYKIMDIKIGVISYVVNSSDSSPPKKCNFCIQSTPCTEDTGCDPSPTEFAVSLVRSTVWIRDG